MVAPIIAAQIGMMATQQIVGMINKASEPQGKSSGDLYGDRQFGNISEGSSGGGGNITALINNVKKSNNSQETHNGGNDTGNDFMDTFKKIATVGLPQSGRTNINTEAVGSVI